jgi:hypothetical protein
MAVTSTQSRLLNRLWKPTVEAGHAALGAIVDDGGARKRKFKGCGQRQTLMACGSSIPPPAMFAKCRLAVVNSFSPVSMVVRLSSLESGYGGP